MTPKDSAWMRAMRRGHFAAAWAETDRVEMPRREQERRGQLVWQPHHLLWSGEPFDGRRVVIRCNHGLGDTLQFVRFVPRVQTVARAVTLMAQPALVDLLRAAPEFGEVRNGWSDEPLPAHDAEVEIMELAYAFRGTPETLSTTVPYLPIVRAAAH